MSTLQELPHIDLPSFCKREKIFVPYDFWSFLFTYKSGDEKVRQHLTTIKGKETVRYYHTLLGEIYLKASGSIHLTSYQDDNEKKQK